MNLKTPEKVEKRKNYEPKKPNSKENIVPPFLKKNFKIRIPRRGDKYYKVLISRGRNRK